MGENTSTTSPASIISMECSTSAGIEYVSPSVKTYSSPPNFNLYLPDITYPLSTKVSIFLKNSSVSPTSKASVQPSFNYR